jgi:hypothetical protein
MAAGAAEPKPFAFAQRAKKTTAPEFPADAKIVLKKIKRRRARRPAATRRRRRV